MILGKALILKGLAGVTAIGGAVTVGVGHMNNWWRWSIDPALKELIEKVGLSCDRENICTQVSGQTTNIKHENTNHENKTIPASGTGKIKVYKLSGENTEYNKKFKFVIEEGDITLNNGGTTNKLEQFETYEIKEEGADSNKKWYFSRKTEAKDEIKRLLGLPDGCTLGANTNCSDIEVDTTKFSSMKFDGVTGTPTSSAAITLKVTKVTPTDPDYPLDYKFELKGKDSTANLTLGSKTITLKQNETTEFKIKVTPSSGATPVSLTLEKAWTAKTLGAKVGLVCPDPSNNGEKKCSFTDGSINVKNDDSNGKIEKAKVKADSTGKKMNYLEDQENYNQGFKFTVDGSESISLTKDANNSTTLNIENTNATYEIKKDESDSKWYLTKKTTTGSSS